MSTSTTEVFTCPPDHKHAAAGTCYHQHRCRCGSCNTRANRKQADTRRLIAYQRWQPFVDACDAQRHLRVLAAYGIGYRRVAELTDLSTSHVRDILRGETRRVRPSTAEKICGVAVDEASLAPGSTVDGRATRRRMEALHAVGWSAAALAPHLSMYRTNVSRLRDQVRVTLRVHQLVADVYERLWNVPPTNSARTQEAERGRAAARGWAPPLAWDDIDVDDAPAVADVGEIVDELAIELAVSGARVKLTRAERLLALPRLHARGFLDGELADLLLVTDRTIVRDRGELGLPANYWTEIVAA